MVIGKEYRQYQGKPDDLTYRAATVAEEEVCVATEKNRIKAVIVSIVFIVVVLFFGYILHLTDYLNIITIAFLLIFMIVAIVNLIRSILDSRKSISFEVAEGIMIYGFERTDSDSASSSGYYDHVAVWCPDQQIYLPSVKCSMYKYTIRKGDELLIVRGYRGEGKKPNFFAIIKNPQ